MCRGAHAISGDFPFLPRIRAGHDADAVRYQREVGRVRTDDILGAKTRIASPARVLTA